MQNKQLLAGLALTALGFAAVPTQAQTVASDNATSYSGGNFSGQNQGTGFQPFVVVVPGDASEDGAFIGSEDNIQNGHSNNNAFDIYANSGGDAVATRGFNAPLSGNETFASVWTNASADTGQIVGVSLNDTAGNALLSLYFVGGDSTYQFTAGTPVAGGGTNTALDFSYYGGVQFSVQLNGANGYTFTAYRQPNYQISTAETYTTSGTLTDSIASVSYYNHGAGNGSDVKFNDMTITGTPAPEPSQTAALGLGVLGLAGLALRARRRTARRAG
jgi:MYXO-CTERM domain-containing protein